jgi:hypothetical protein
MVRFAVFTNDPNGTAPGGVFDLGELTFPAAPLGAIFTMQFGYLDPTVPAGFRMSWARIEEL